MNLHENEKLIQMIRQHPLKLFNVIGPPLGLMLLFFVFVFYFQFNFFGYPLQVLGLIVLGCVAWGVYRGLIWYKNCLYVTDQRIIGVIQAGLFDRTVAELLYSDIHEIRFIQKGPEAMAINYGTIVIKTLADHELIFPMVAKPEKTVNLINDIRSGKLKSI